MEFKKAVTYRVPFRSKGILFSGIFLAASVFLRCLYYFFPCDFTNYNFLTWSFGIFLPILLCVGFGILIRVVRLRAPGIYGILAAALCITLLVSDLNNSNVAQTIFSLVTMPLLGFLLLITYGGFIPFRSIGAFSLALVGIFRIVFWTFSGAAWVTLLGDTMIFLGLLCFTVSLRPVQE